MRGEDHGEALTVTILDGSPPHARGRLSFLPCWEPASRITPACAGKTRGVDPPLIVTWDHPRMRGEDAGTAS